MEGTRCGAESEHAMSDKPQLHHPWLVAVWPGMSQVAFNAGVYFLASRVEGWRGIP